MEQCSTRIKEAMRIRNMKQSELIRLTGINKGSLSCYLSGKYEPKQDKIYLLSSALNVSPVWLMGLDVPMERETFLVRQDKRLKVNQFINELDNNSFDKLEDFLVKFFGYEKKGDENNGRK